MLKKLFLSKGLMSFLMVFLRTFLFFSVGLAIFLCLKLINTNQNSVDLVQFWPVQVVIVNLITLVILKTLLKKEGKDFNSLINWRKVSIKKDTLFVLITLIPGILITVLGTFLASYLIYGTNPPQDLMIQKMPVWIAVIGLFLFPLTSALTELTTYFGYSFERIESSYKSKVFPIFLSSFGLALQHVFLPLTGDLSFYLYRFLAFFPLALGIGIIYSRIRRLRPFLIGHFFMDFQLILTVLFISLG